MIAELAPVVGYDRPGIGGSTFPGTEPEPGFVTSHAHELFRVLDVGPPYILIGHSWGGPLILHYVGEYPDEVVGLVYLDPSDPFQTRREYFQARTDDEMEARQAQYSGFLAELNLPAGILAEAEAIDAFQGLPLEERGLPENPDLPTAMVLGTLPAEIPPGAPPFMDEAFVAATSNQRIRRFSDWMRGLSKATLIIATDAGHFVHRDDPALSAEAVRRVVAAVKGGAPSGEP
jgi:pimeloyl-ACP methyl ester carboxylesterase